MLTVKTLSATILHKLLKLQLPSRAAITRADGLVEVSHHDSIEVYRIEVYTVQECIMPYIHPSSSRLWHQQQSTFSFLALKTYYFPTTQHSTAIDLVPPLRQAMSSKTQIAVVEHACFDGWLALRVAAMARMLGAIIKNPCLGIKCGDAG